MYAFSKKFNIDNDRLRGKMKDISNKKDEILLFICFT